MTDGARERYREAMARAAALSTALAGPGWIERWARLPREKRDDILGGLSRAELARLAYDWTAWARPKQDPDLSALAHRVLLFLGGRGSGKSAMAIQRIKRRVYAGARRMALIGPTIGEIERYMIGVDDDEDGLLAAFHPRHRPQYVGRPTPRVTFHTGAFAYVESAENPEFRGANLDTAWCDEPIKWRKLKTLFENVENAVRSATFQNEIIVTTTAKKTAAGRFLRELIADPDTVTILGSSDENKYNDPGWLANRKRKLAGTRAGREELDPDESVLDDDENALFHESWIDDNRVEAAPKVLRVAVGVDPAITQSERSDLTGIVVVGEAPDGDLYVLEDRTGRHSAAAWGRIVVDLYDKHQADAIVAEKNRGGELVDEVLRGAMSKKRGDRAADAMIVKLVTASKGKTIRAEPVSALYEKGRVHHVPREELAELEREMTEWEPASGMPSPNRLDALVWAIHFLARLDDDDPDPRDTTRGLAAITAAASKAATRMPARPLAPSAMPPRIRLPPPKRTI